MHDHRPRRVRFTATGELAAPPERVFPELCPLCEHHWIEGWRSETLLPESGHAELDCLFTTRIEGHEIWMVTRFEPPRRIEFAIFSDAGLAGRLAVSLELSEEGGSRITWERVETWLRPTGDRLLEARSQAAYDARIEGLNRRLDHYLEHGTMLREHHGHLHR